MKLNIETYTLGPLATNAYLLTSDQSDKAVIIDPGMKPAALLRRIEDLEIEAILLTHAHFDHIGGVEAIRREKGCPVYLHEAEADWLENPEFNGSTLWPEVGEPIRTAAPEVVMRGGERLKLIGCEFKVYHTPGHSPGSVSFLHGADLFSGDVLFMLGVGRTDLRGGSSKELYNSIHGTLFQMDDAVRVHPGHGPGTTIGRERANNPYV